MALVLLRGPSPARHSARQFGSEGPKNCEPSHPWAEDPRRPGRGQRGTVHTRRSRTKQGGPEIWALQLASRRDRRG
eukprot:9255853-Pyramimonas_sp.AAC.1